MARKSKKKTRWIIAGVVCAAALIAMGAVGVVMAKQLSSARHDLAIATANAKAIKESLIAGDTAEAKKSLATLQGAAESAQDAIAGPQWSIAEKLPSLGRNVTAARILTDVLGDVAQRGLPPILDASEALNADTFSLGGGAIDIDAIARLAPNISEAEKVLHAANERARQVDPDGLMARLRPQVRSALEQLDTAAIVSERAAKAAEIIPRMLGGKHSYLLIFQNNAEIRTTAGMPGAWAEIKVNNGKVSLGRQSSAAGLGDLPKVAIPLTAEEIDLYDTKLGSDFRDVNFTPDFPRAAEISQAIMEQELGLKFDGVLSLDPVTLAYVLDSFGTITMSDGTTINSGNAVDILLNQVYARYPENKDQDAFFAEAVEKLFERITGPSVNSQALLDALVRASSERRLYVWSADESIQDDLTETALSGAVPFGEAAKNSLGFYLNDATGAKMQYYLEYDVAAKSAACSASGVQTYDTIMKLISNAPAESAQLPVSIKGPGFGAQPGSMLMVLYVYAPDGGTIEDLTIDGEEIDWFEGTHQGRPVAQVAVQVDPGVTVSVETKIATGEAQRGDAQVAVTPSIQPKRELSVVKSSCS